MSQSEHPSPEKPTEGQERALLVVVGSIAIGAAVLRSLKPEHAGWFDPTRIDERVFALLMVPFVWYFLRIAKSFKFGKDGFEWERLEKAVIATRAATEDTRQKLAETKEQVAATHTALAYGVGGGKHPPDAHRGRLLSLRDVAAGGATEPSEPGVTHEADDAPRGEHPVAARGDENPEDPQKGRWGGAATRDGRQLSAQVTPVAGSGDLFTVTLFVTALDGPPISGPVVFHLHPTFTRTDPTVVAKDGQATLSLVAWGAFTVGAEVDAGRTPLELDLATLPGVPRLFASR